MAFDTTHWSLIVAARGDDSASRLALSTLCEQYWYPIYAYVRRQGVPADDARDVTQGFFALILDRRDVARVDQSRGRFRAFLLASLQHYLANQRAHERAAKRGGGVPLLPLEFGAAEQRFRREPIDPLTPEHLYTRQWARTVLDRVLSDLRAEWSSAGKRELFEALKHTLIGAPSASSYATLASTLGVSEGAVKITAHRLRRQYRDRLRAHVAETVADPAEVDDELRALARALTP